MKAGWEIKKLGEVCQFINGRAYKKAELLNNGKYPVLRVGNFFTQDKWYFSDLELPENKYCDNGDLLYAWSASFGPRIWQGEKVIYHYHIWKIIENANLITKEFLYFLLDWDTDNLKEKYGTGTTMTHVGKGSIESREVPLPPLPEQRRIVAILDEAFAGIAAAKESAEKNLKNAKEVFASAINSIEGKKVNLGDYVEIKTGKLDANAAEENGKYPFFTCSREIFSINNFSFDCEAILLAGNNAVGDFNVKYFNGKFNAYQRTYVITANKRRQILCKYLYIQLLNSLKKFKEKSVGAATKFLKLGMIKEMQIILPSLLEQETIISNLSCIQERTEKLESIYQQKLSNLEELKKSLLQQAFSGAL